MSYTHGYNEFHTLSQIKSGGKPMSLVQYSYRNQNGALKSMRYANAHTVEYTYDGNEIVSKNRDVCLWSPDKYVDGQKWKITGQSAGKGRKLRYLSAYRQ